MGWAKKIVSVHRHGHTCRKPFLWLWIKVGSIWVCDECEAKYVVFKYRNGSGFKDWRQIL